MGFLGVIGQPNDGRLGPGQLATKKRGHDVHGNGAPVGAEKYGSGLDKMKGPAAE